MSDIFDRTGALGRVAGDEALLLELIELARAHVVTSLPVLAEAAQRGRAEEVQHIAHRLRSAFGNLGALKVYDVGTELERAAGSGRMEDCQRMTSLLANLIDEFFLAAWEGLRTSEGERQTKS